MNRLSPAALAVASVAAVAALATAMLPAAADVTGRGSGYWHTSGSRILDGAGNQVRIAGINWYGFETPDAVAHGLWVQDYHAVVDGIKNLGYNTIRIPISNQTVESDPVPTNMGFYNSTGPINLDIKGLTSLQILDKIVGYAGQDGLKIIIDDHRSESGNSAEQNGLWYTSAYPSTSWVADWTALATRYAGNPTVIGFDLRNEPHTPGYTPYAQGATWGSGDPNTDIRPAYQTAGNAILAVDPNALIFCEGISEYPNSAGGLDSTWWGGQLEGVATAPVTLSHPGHVVYSAHDYGPHEYAQTWFNSTTTAASLGAQWDKTWGYIAKNGTAPVWVGEFGTPNATTDVSDSTPGSQGQWFSSLVAYIKTNSLSWTYWALNGEDAYGLLDNGYDLTPAQPAKQSALATIQDPLGAGGGGPTTGGTSSGGPTTSGSATSTPPPPPPALSCHVSYTLVNQWQGGFQVTVTVNNTGSSAINGWSLAFTFPNDQKITGFWQAAVTQTGAAVTAANLPYNASIPAAGNVQFGFQGTVGATDQSPTAFKVNGAACT
jgi:endoglucanase